MFLLARAKKLLCRYMVLTEYCRKCGKKQPILWWADSDALWYEVTGSYHNGIYCPYCFDKLARRKGIFVRWRVSEGWRIELNDV